MVMWVLRSAGALVWRQNAGVLVLAEGPHRRIVKVGPPGMPDVLAVLPGGRFCAVEVKATGRLTAHQSAFLKALRDVGGLCFVVRRPEDVDALFEAVRRLKHAN
ncbi:MAG: VRR-NUC domain-containing protein [Thermofilaceae archaeon]